MAPHLDTLTTALADRYRIERELGAGGMATVYLAHDVRHDRRVALKVLKPELSAVVGAERFLAEIRTTANLQHPHILSLFDSGSVDGTVFYVMPFVDGESLRDRLDREKQLPIDEALRIAREVADALQHAHDHGVIHRDIKPENILLQGGHAMVADFGIALAASNTAGGRITETGMSLGTPAYMSPEQAMGERTLNARTDIYALGCVVYEMLVGEPPFTGATAQQIVARVMTEEPRSLTGQRRTISPAVDDAVAAALSKLPADRPASAAAFAAMLSADSGTAYRVGTGARTRERARVSPAMIALGIAFLAAASLAARGFMRGEAERPVTRNFIKFAAGEEPAFAAMAFTLLPDGSALVYVGKSATGTQLWIKRRSELHATPIGGTVGATNAFVKPDGQWIGFFANGKVRKVPVAGGDAATLADASCYGVACEGASFQGSGAWLDDGRIVYRTADALVIIPDNGGMPDSIVTSKSIGGLSPIYPIGLPGSRGVLFTICTIACNKASAYAFDFATRTSRKLVESAAYATYSPTGHLLYADAAGAVYAIAFDPHTLTTSGTATSVLQHVAGDLALASDGTLAYLDGNPSPASYLAIVGKDGSEQPVDSSWRGNVATLALSPDGRRIATSIVTGAGEEHVWLKNVGSAQPPTRLTFGKAQYTTPAFSSDGSTVFMTRFAGDSSSFLSRRVDGTGAEAVYKRGKQWVIESLTSRDGKWLVTRGYREGVRAIYAKRIDAGASDTAERVVVQNAYSNFSPALSPDGRWLLYVNEETGSTEVWAVPFPDANGARWQVSAAGGSEPAWSRDGRTIYYVDPDRKLVGVEVSPIQSGFAIGARKELFSVRPYRRHPTHRAYEVLPDGRFLMIREGVRGAGELVVVENWFGELRASAANK